MSAFNMDIRNPLTWLLAPFALLGGCSETKSDNSPDASTDVDSDTDTDVDTDTDTYTDTEPDCTPNAYQQCGTDGSVHWFDSCDVEGELVDDCLACETCVEPSDTTAECQTTTVEAYQQCGTDGNVHWFDSCAIEGALVYTCAACETCENTSDTTAECQTTTAEAYQQCGTDGNVHWFDSCDVEGAEVNTCAPCETCEDTSDTTAECQTTTAEAYQQCGTDGDVHWFDSCNMEGIEVDTCAPCETCVEPSGTTAECQTTTAEAYQQCGTDGNVHWYDSCNVEGTAIDDCSTCGTCVEPSSTTAECQATTVEAYQQCGTDGDVHWFDSCAIEGALVYACDECESCVEPSDTTAECQEATLTGVQAITAGSKHTCALLISGGVKCWGSNQYNQLGNGEMSESEVTPVDVVGLSSGVQAIAAGAVHTCAVLTSGDVKCWGNNSSGQLGNGETSEVEATPVDVVGLSSDVQDIAAGGSYTYGSHTCALMTSGGMKCWGLNDDGQLGDGVISYYETTPVDVVGLSSDVQDIETGAFHTCAVLTSGGLKCWGDNYYGQLGDGTYTDSSTPMDVVSLSSGVQAVVAGSGHTCTVLTSGGAKCWGANDYGQLGDGNGGVYETANTPMDVVGLSSGVQTTAAGFEHTCALMASGGMKCWGINYYGQLGDGTGETMAYEITPVNVFGLSSGVQAISAGGNHTCAILTSGGVKCWGNNHYGELGNGISGTDEYETTPVDVFGLSSDVQAIAAGSEHTCALLMSGGIKCWGDNGDGQVGDGSPSLCKVVPFDVVGLTSGVQTIATGRDHTCAVLTSGGLKCWGANSFGQLGNGAEENTKTPVDVVGLSSDAQTIAAGGSHTCAVLTSGGVKCWGNNEDGQLGDGGAEENATTPVDVMLF